MDSILDWLGNFFIDTINYIILGVGSALGAILYLFPDTPFMEPSRPPESINLGWVTWLIDFPVMIQHAIALGGVILIFYGIRVLARWIKLIRS